MELWEKGLHTGLVGDAEAEGNVREARSACGGEEEDENTRSYHNTVLLGNMRQAVCWATDREGGGCLLPDNQ